MSMVAMLDTSESLTTCEEEIGCGCEQLLTPLTRFKLQRPDGWFGIDNGAFKRLDVKGLMSLLDREKANRKRCRFVALPDVVASARRTQELFEHFHAEGHFRGWPLALVAQDGLEDLDIPWRKIQAVFIGGSTAWKLGPHAAAVVKTAQALGKWVHVGRVNTPGRFEYFEEMGADSIDGSGLARFSEMRKAIAERRERPTLFAGPA